MLEPETTLAPESCPPAARLSGPACLASWWSRTLDPRSTHLPALQCHRLGGRSSRPLLLVLGHLDLLGQHHLACCLATSDYAQRAPGVGERVPLDWRIGQRSGLSWPPGSWPRSRTAW